jgi:hypothetical protein
MYTYTVQGRLPTYYRTAYGTISSVHSNCGLMGAIGDATICPQSCRIKLETLVDLPIQPSIFSSNGVILSVTVLGKQDHSTNESHEKTL